ncbi:hypothetical protein ACUHMQ_14785 [Chitinimonas sp. PSY-7]|uniref:hypothetical protein n=1 Tax=Chitinimonas sp. PSY-7 TaxID=3459088 RepID=UPI0040403400
MVDLPAVVDDAAKANETAQRCGVDVARRGFMSKLCSLALAGLGLGMAIAVTALTSGAGTPLLVLAGVGFTLALADAGCALYDWRSKAGGGSGLPMEGNSIANGVYALARQLKASESTAGKLASYTSIGVRSALTIGNMVTGFLNPVSVAGSAAHAMNILSTLVRPISNEVNGAVASTVAIVQGDKQKADVAAAVEETKTAHKQEAGVTQEIIKAMQEELKFLREQMAKVAAGEKAEPYLGPSYV